MLEDTPIVNGDERLVRALTALDARLLADAAHPLVGARRRVPLLLRLCVLPLLRKDVGAPTEEIAEQGHLLRRGRRGRRGTRRSSVHRRDRKVALERFVELSNLSAEHFVALAQGEGFLLHGAEAYFAGLEFSE